jgi:hypothetical protein
VSRASRPKLVLGMRPSIPQQPVVGNRLPAGGGLDSLTLTGPNARVHVERCHANRRDLRQIRRATEEARAAHAAEDLRPAVRGLKGAEQLLALRDPQRAGADPCLCRRGIACAALASLAVAVARRDRGSPTSKRTAPHRQPPVSNVSLATRHRQRLEHVDRRAGHFQVRVILE